MSASPRGISDQESSSVRDPVWGQDWSVNQNRAEAMPPPTNYWRAEELRAGAELMHAPDQAPAWSIGNVLQTPGTSARAAAVRDEFVNSGGIEANLGEVTADSVSQRPAPNFALLRSVRRAAPCAPPQNAGPLGSRGG